MQRISSYKANWTYVLPKILLILFFYCSLSFIVISDLTKAGVYISLLSLPIIVIPKIYSTLTGKEIYLGNGGVRIKSLKKEIFVPTSNIKRVSGGKVHSWWVGTLFRYLDLAVIIDFYEVTPFGTRVSFEPIGNDFGPDNVHKIVDELMIMIQK